MASLTLTTLSTLRMAAGVGLLAAPRLTTIAFLVPYASSASLITRMGGVRDFVLGALLFTANRNRSASASIISSPSDEGVVKPDTEPLLGGVRNGEMGEVRRALMAGMLVDAVDIVSCLVCMGEGTLPLEGMGIAGGGAVVFLGLGAWGLRAVGRG